MSISLHLESQATCSLIGCEIHNNDFLFSALQRTQRRRGQRGRRHHVPRGTSSCSKTPAMVADAAQSAVLEGCWTKHTSPSQNRSGECGASLQESVHFLILFDPFSSVSAVLWSCPLLHCEHLICGPTPPTKGMLKLWDEEVKQSR